MEGQRKNAHLETAYAFASPRERTKHTASLQLLGSTVDEDGLEDLSFDEIRSKLGRHVSLDKALYRGSKKLFKDERLNFDVESHPQFEQAFYREYLNKANNRTLDFQRTESDQLILSLAREINQVPEIEREKYKEGVRQVKGYIRMAGDMAQMIQRYFRALSLWKKTYHKNPQKYPSEEMQVFMATHSQNLECFLMKFMEMKNPQAFEDFRQALPDGKSFIGFSEGISVEIDENNGDVIGKLIFRDIIWDITWKDLAEIIREQADFDRKVNEILASVESS